MNRKSEFQTLHIPSYTLQEYKTYAQNHMCVFHHKIFKSFKQVKILICEEETYDFVQTVTTSYLPFLSSRSCTKKYQEELGTQIKQNSYYKLSYLVEGRELEIFHEHNGLFDYIDRILEIYFRFLAPLIMFFVSFAFCMMLSISEKNIPVFSISIFSSTITSLIVNIFLFTNRHVHTKKERKQSYVFTICCFFSLLIAFFS